MDISPKLQMNLHPKDVDNLSFVTAQNVKLSNDGSCFTNEESIRENSFIRNFLQNHYKDSNGNPLNHTIVGIIPCNNELVIIAVSNDNNTIAQIFRYREATSGQVEAMKCVYGGDNAHYLQYSGGKIKGTFTYNVENSLIIAIAEYDAKKEFIPLKTINLGNFDDDTVYNDLNVFDNHLSVSPEVHVPTMKDIMHIAGNAYKGWYYFFIRYKINSIDYTQWFSFGFPIYIDSLERFSITKYCYKQHNDFAGGGAWDIVMPKDAVDGYCAGASDYFSSTSDIANTTVNFKINFDYNDNFDKFQIGLICSSKSSTKAYRSADINFANSYDFIVNFSSLIEASAEEFIIDNYNYFDVKNVINYKNRLYISNYKESNANNDNIIKSGIIDKITIKPSPVSIPLSEVVTDLTISGRQDGSHNAYSNQYAGNSDYAGDVVTADVFFNVKPNTYITIQGDCEFVTGAWNTDGEGNYTNMRESRTSGMRTITIQAKDLQISNYEDVKCVWNEGYWSINRPSVRPHYITIVYISNLFSSEITNPPQAFIFRKSVTIKIEDNQIIENYININCEDYAINGGSDYINPNDTFANRCLQRVFIPGEVYNFFIHFVDKYGHCTNGYRIANNNKWKENGESDNDLAVVPFIYNGNYYYATFPFLTKVTTTSGALNTNGMNIYRSINSVNYTLSNKVTDADVINYFNKLFNSFSDVKYSNTYWYQISSANTSVNLFFPYMNNNNDRLFRFPIHQNDTYNYYGWSIIVENVTIPDGYVGYFISYEKFEPIKRITGLLTRSDFRSQDCIIRGESVAAICRTANTEKSNYMYLYSGQYDISDSIRLDYNVLKIEGVNVWDVNDIPTWDYNQRCNNYKFCVDMNKPQNKRDNNGYEVKVFAMPNYKLTVADSAIDNRMGLGTALQIDDSYGLFPDYNTTYDEGHHNLIKLYKVSLYNVTRDIYMSENKTLIRCSNILYGNKGSNNTIEKTNIAGNGFVTYNNFIVYENAGFNFNTANNIAYRTNLNTKYYSDNIGSTHTYNNVNTPFLAYIQMPCFDTVMYESKCFKNEPTGYYFYVQQDTSNLDKANENNKFQAGCIVTPANSIDLFENRQGDVDMFYTKIFTNYREDLISVDEFNKTVRRSSVIQDETRANGWRTFPVEGYKNITENKGIITNLVGIGTILLVHTEHSLFMFNTDNTLTTNESQKVQLAQPDAFEVSYVEVLTSSLGYGGLQDDKAFVVDQFGYTFYNNDFHRFYNFDNGQLNVIDDDIIQWLDKYKPYGVRFANDKFNNRLIIKMNYKVAGEEKETLLSYNYGVNHFVSIHDYTFEEAYNTKFKLYMRCPSNSHSNCNLHEFVQDGTSYGSFDNGRNTIGVATTYLAKVGIMINEQFDDIKFLEQLTYKLVKTANPADKDYTNLPVEELVTPYSADTIRVYNNEVDTGTLDILINKEDSKNIFCNYTKPYWELGNWNFNYLRNKLADYANYGDAFNMSRIYGNYFVVEYTFSNVDNLKIEFEELKYKIIK